jgi:transposase
MPQERSDMRRVKEVLRLAHELGYSLRQISRSVRLSSTSVRNYLARADAAGVRYDDIADSCEAEIEAVLFKQPDLPPSRPQPNWVTVAEDLRKDAVTLQLLWQEYRDQHPDGYSYSQFRRRYREHLKVTPEPRMRRTPTPAEACEVDYAGMTMPVMAPDGERQVSIFVGTLPFSTIIYAEATWTQTTEDWLGSHVRMFNAWGGSVPKLVPDNLKTGVTHPSFYDPVLNPSYLALARHYEIGTRRDACLIAASKCLFVLSLRYLRTGSQPACAIHGINRSRKMECNRLSAGCWRRCATAPFSAWMR